MPGRMRAGGRPPPTAHRAPSPASTSSGSDSPASSVPDVVTHTALERILTGRSHELTHLFHRFSTRLNDTNVRMDQGFADTNSRIDTTNSRINTTNSRMEKGFADTNSRIDTTNARMEKGFADTNSRIDDLLALYHNARSFRPFDTVYPLLVTDVAACPATPLPGTVAKLWKLQKPESHAELASWIHAYGIDEWRFWRRNLLFAGCDSYEQDLLNYSDEEEAQEYTDLAQAISNHPKMALEALAYRLGLDVQKINGLVERAAARAREMGSKKREPDLLPWTPWVRQPRQPSPRPTTPGKHPLQLPSRLTTPSRSLELGWDANMNLDERPVMVFKDAPGLRPPVASPSPPAFPIASAQKSPPYPPSHASTTVPDEE